MPIDGPTMPGQAGDVAHLLERLLVAHLLDEGRARRRRAPRRAWRAVLGSRQRKSSIRSSGAWRSAPASRGRGRPSRARDGRRPRAHVEVMVRDRLHDAVGGLGARVACAARGATPRASRSRRGSNARPAGHEAAVLVARRRGRRATPRARPRGPRPSTATGTSTSVGPRRRRRGPRRRAPPSPPRGARASPRPRPRTRGPPCGRSGGRRGRGATAGEPCQVWRICT